MAVNSTPNLIIACTCNLLLMGLVLFQSAIAQTSTPSADVPPHITAIDDFRLLQLDESYTLPVKIRDDNGDDIKISIALGDESVVSTTPTVLDISENTTTENTVYFQLTPLGLGKTSVTLSASDGISTSTETFEITVVANIAPTIDGIETQQTVSIFVGAPLVLRFRVNDPNVGSEKNENIQVTVMKNSGRISTALYENPSGVYFLVLSTTNAMETDQVTISISDASGGMTKSIVDFNLLPRPSFIRSRFTVRGQLFGCSQCDPLSDGIVHIRFAPDAPIRSHDGVKDFIRFTVQLRRINGSDTPRYLTVASTQFNYDGSVLRCTNENTPVDLFAGKDYGVITNRQGDDLFSYNQISSEGLDIPNPDLVSTLGSDWEDFVVMKCDIIGDQMSEAGIAIHASEGPNANINEYISPDTSVAKGAFVLADNDLRGFRLDGKTYARDYARYGDGRGVRVEFSKGIATQLTNQHFDVHFVNSDTEVPDVERVIHTSGSRYADILISRPVQRAVIRLVSTRTSIVEDIEGNSLADGNFVAALEYDTAAPRATTITKVSFADGVSTWNIGFNEPIATNTVHAENLCITNEDGICADPGLATTPSIIATSLVGNTTMSVVITEIGSKRGATHSLEFRRNAILGEDFRIVEDYQKVLRDAVTIEDRFKLECGGFYPNIGQTELFFKITRDSVNPQGLTLMQNGNLLDAEIEQIGNTVREVSIFKATFPNEISNGADIEAVYTAQDDIDTTTCIAELYKDSDGDGLADIVDEAPFDASVRMVNTEVASTAPLAEPPAEVDVFYSRDVLIRSLFRGTEFDYVEVESNRPVKRTFTSNSAMTAAVYFGINNPNARVFRVNEQCETVLDAARDMNLTKVKINEYCLDVGDNFGSEPVGMRRYIWAVVENGYLVASNYRSYELNVAAEINFWGQSSYLYDRATTSKVIISTDIDEVTDIQIQVNHLSDTGIDELQTLLLTLTNGGSELETQANYALADQTIGHPSIGETVTHWLAGSSQVWQPTSDILIPKRGGYPEFNDIDYAIGSDNAVDIKLVQAGETITRINRIMLYDVADPTLPRVSSMVSGRMYYLIADLMTNISDIASQVSLSSDLIDGYTITTPSEILIDRIGSDGHFDNTEYFPVIALEVDDTSTTRTISVGWNRLGDLSDIQAICVVTPNLPERYAEADGDGDIIPDSLDLRPADATELQVAIGTEVGGINRLRTNTEKPLFVSDIGLIRAIGEGSDDSVDYSPANIIYDNLSLGTKTLLGFDDTDTAMQSLTTFGVSDVDYAIGNEGELVGGVAYTVFPIESSTASEILYLGTYNKNARRWERFDQDAIAGYIDTWYAIEHPNDGSDCPIDVQKYRNEYRSDGMHGMGFAASTRNCIMLIISDGGPYDDSSRDGRIVALNGISSMPFSFDRVFPPRPIIRVVAANSGRAMINTHDASGVTYSMRYEVFAGGTAQGLNDPSSYSLLRIRDDGTSDVITAIASVMPVSGRPNTVIVSYDEVRLNDAELRETSGFTLARNGTGLSGTDSIEPIRYSSGEVIAPGMRLDLSPSAIANTTPFIDEIDDFKLIPLNEAYPLAVTITDNIGDVLSVSIEADNTELMSTTPAFIEIASGGKTTNTVVFGLTPIAVGKVVLTVLASDGTTTDTQTFTVEIIENVPPVIEGIETGSIDLYLEASYVFNFRVRDMNLGVARNEELNAPTLIDSEGRSNFIYLEENLNDGYSLIITILFENNNVTISVTDNAGARAEVVLFLNLKQTDFIRSRFSGPLPNIRFNGEEAEGAACLFCDPTEDGFSRVRFAPDSVRLLNENGESFIEFSVEGKHSEPNRLYHILLAGSILKYNADAFGENLNNPFLTIPGSNASVLGDQCTYRSGLPDIFKDNGYGVFYRSLSNDVLAIAQISKHFVLDSNEPQSVAMELLTTIGSDWKKLFTIKCKVVEGQTNKEAGFAIHTDSTLRVIDFTRSRIIGGRILLPLVDNDILGFRLDGKTYVRDYARYGDGRGVRVEFSKGISTQLTTQHFVVRFADDSTNAPDVSQVIHTSGSPYANILIDEPVEGAVMRLVSTGTTVIEDIEGGSLADGSFVAALEYDASAPHATTITRVSLVDGISTWDIGFSAPIRATTVRAENLCITNDDNVCAMLKPTTPSAIVSASLSSATTMTVVVNEVDIATESGRSLEFRRNTVLGEDFRVVEDYQEPLRNQVAIRDSIPPTITVVAGNHGRAMIVEERSTYITYDFNFMIYASEPVVGLTDPNSYQLLRVPSNGILVPIVAVPQVTPILNRQNAVMLSYTDIRLEKAVARESRGFTLGRVNSQVINDLSGNNPVGLSDSSDNTEPLDIAGVRSESAVAVIRASIYLIDLKVSLGELVPSFSSATTFYRVAVSNETTSIKVIPTSGDNDTITISLLTGDGRTVYQANTDIPLNQLGEQGNIIEVVVESESGVDSNTYTIQVIRAFSRNADLSNIVISKAGAPVSLTPAFNVETTTYTASVSNDTRELQVTAIASDEMRAGIQISVDDGEFEALATKEIDIRPGHKTTRGFETAVTIKVTADDGETSKSYTVILIRLLDVADTTLQNLEVSPGQLRPEYTTATFAYTVNVAATTATIKVIPTVNDSSTATIILLTGDSRTVYQANTDIPLNELGERGNIIEVVVESENGVDSSTYTIQVIRAFSRNADLSDIKISKAGALVSLTPAFNVETTTYTASVSNDTRELQVATVASDEMRADIQISVDGNEFEEVSTKNIDIQTGHKTTRGFETAVTIKVTADDGETSKSYTVILIRSFDVADATLHDLEVLPGNLQPEYTTSTFVYTVNVATTTATIRVIPTTNNNGTATISLLTGDSRTVYQANTDIPLNELGEQGNIIEIMVESESGVDSNIYTIQVIRAFSGNADLRSILISKEGIPISLTPAFNSETTTYTASVSNDTRELQVATVASDEMHADIQISVDENEFEVLATKEIGIWPGHKTMRGLETAVTVKVTADDGETSKSYTVIIIRSFDVVNAILQNLEVSPGNLQPEYTTATFAYTVNVAATTATIKVIPTTINNSTATIILLTEDSRTVYQANTDIPLNQLGGQGNIIEIIIESEDGINSNIYIIQVIRAFSGNADLSDIVISKEDALVSLTPAFNSETTTYTASVSNNARELQVTAIASDEMRADIQISVDGSEFEEVSTKNINIWPGHKTMRGFETAVTIKVTADDGETSKSYTMILIRSFDVADATLHDLEVSPGQLQPEYTTATFAYTVNVAATTATIRVIPTTNNNGTATISLVTENSRTVYQANTDIPLNQLGEQGNIIQVAVVSGDGEHSNIYTIKVIRPFSRNTDLSDIVISKADDPVSLTPAFNVETTDYTASVSNDTQELRVTAVASDEMRADIQISIDDGEFEEVSTKNIDIQTGHKTTRGFETAVAIKVTADDGETSKSYTVILIRSFDVAGSTLQNLEVSPGQLQPEYTTATFAYTVNVAATTATIKVIPTINDNSTATITLVTEDSRTVYQANTDIPLNQLGEQGNIIQVAVVSGDGEHSNIYTIKVIRVFSRNADLSDIVISKADDPVSLTPAFNVETTDYTASVSNDTRELRVTAVASDEMRAGIQISIDDGEFEEVSTKNIDIQTGHKTTRGFETAVTIKVTADDGETSKSYTVILIRSFDVAGSTLQNLEVSPGQLQPEYTTATFSYTVNVAATTATIKVIPTINDNSTATITLVTEDSRTVYQANTDIPLNQLGEQGNIIQVAVVSGDGEHSNIYTIKVIRPFSRNADLSDIVISKADDPVSLTPAFNVETTDYTASVSNDTQELRVTAVASDEMRAGIQISIDDGEFEEVSTKNIDIQAGHKTMRGFETAVTIKVTADDGETSKSYTVILIRSFDVAGSTLQNLEVSPGQLQPEYTTATFAYTVNVAATTATIRVIPTTNNNGTATISLVTENSRTVYQANTDIPLNQLGEQGNIIQVAVVSGDGEHSNIYTIKVIRPFSRNADLSDIVVSKADDPVSLTPAFNVETTDYTASVSNDTQELRVTAVASDEMRAGIQISIDDGEFEEVSTKNIDIQTGHKTTRGFETAVTIKVTADDGETSKSYTVTLIRSFDVADATLHDLEVSPGQLQPEYTTATFSYTVNVAATTATIRVIPTTNNNGTATISLVTENSRTVYQANTDIPLNQLGEQGNIIEIMVESESGVDSNTYTIKVIRAFSGNADLSDIVISKADDPVSLTPAFNVETTDYTASVSNDTQELRVTAVASDEMRAGIQISIDDGEFEEVSTKNIDIQTGHKTTRGFETAVTIKVTADDGETSKSYTVTLIRSFDVADATLHDLEVSPGQLQPEYTTATFSYTVNVAATTATIRVIPTTNNNGTATISLVTENSRTVYQANADIPLNQLGGQGNIIQVAVVSGDGEHSNIYTIKVIRPFSRNADLSDIVISKADDPVSLTPAFNVETTDYTASVSNDTQELRVTAVASDEMRAGIQISIDDGEFEEVSTKNIDIQTGHKTTRGFETAVAIKVTADDGETSKSYTVILIRSFDVAGSTLQNLEVSPGQLQPEYTTATFSYTVNVAATTATIKVIPTINDNSTATITLVTEDSRTVYQANTDIPLNQLGEQGNIIQVAVVSGDGEHSNIYTIKVIRAFSRNADLSDIVISKEDALVSLTPAFNVETTDYTASVSNDTQELRVTAVASDEMRAGIQISIDDGEFEEVSTKNIDIQTGHKTTRGFETAVTIKVTADDGETSKSYTVILIRSFDVAGSTLQNLEVSPGQLQPEYTTATFSYTVNVAATTATIKVIPTINDNSTATITLVTEDSRTVYQANTDIPLNQLGEQGNIIQVAVVSGDGEHSNIYTIKVIRPFSRNADLSDIVISKADDPVSLTPAFNVETTDYTASVSNDTQELRVTAVASDEMRADIQISIDDGEFEEVSTKNIDIQTGHKTTRGFETAVAIKVTADDGETSKSYTVILIRSFDVAGSTLQNLEVSPGQLQPEYTTATFSYTVNVAATTATIKVIPTINDNSTAIITLVTEDSRTVYQANTDIPLNQLGEQGNIIQVAVVSGDGEHSNIYTIKVIRAFSRNADLSDIVISKADDPVSLTPAFNVETTDYTASVSNDTQELRVTAVASDEMRAGIQISIDDGEFEEVSTKNIDIQTGHKTMRGFETAVAIKVTADDGETSKSYTVILIRSFDVAGSTLQNLEVSPGQLQPEYTTATFSYTVNVAATTATIKMIPTINDNSTATITLLTGDSRTVYQANTDIPLNELGEQGNIIQVTVVSGDGEHSNIYTIKVIRAFSRNADLSDIVISKADDLVSLTPTFNGETTDYTVSVSNDTRELQVTAIASDEMRAGIQISVDDGEFEKVSTKDIDIQAGHKTARGFETAVTIKVTADDGETSKSYIVILIRSFDVAGATLQNLEVSPGQLQPKYTTATFSYTVNVAATTATIRVIPTINDNSTAIITLVTEDSRTVYQANTDIPLNQLGEQGNIIEIMVESESGVDSNTYTIKVIRAFSANADLSDIVISKAGDLVSLTPTFNVETTDYTASVSNDTRELRVSAVASDEMRADIQISVDDGEFEEVSTKDIDIQAGHKTMRGFETAVTIKVTADDDETSKSYTVTLIRSFDVADATLQNLEVSPGQLQPGYTTATFVYTVNVAATTATIRVIPTINDNSTAIITLVTEDSRTVYQANTDIPLNQLGEQGNIIEIMVESESGVDSNTYTIKVIRAFSRNADLSDIVISKAGDLVSLTPTFNGETTDYTVSVSNDTRELRVSAVASDKIRAGIQISVDDGEFEEVLTKDVDIQAGYKTARGFETAVTIKVTADDDETSKSYTVTLIRSFDVADATLQNLEVSPGQLQPGYTTATFVYTVNVAATTATVRVIPTTNNNGTVTISLLTGDSRTVYQANTDIPLNQLGEQGNIIQVAVVSGDGEHSNIYTIKVIRAFSGNADLSDIVISKASDPVSLTPAFNVETTDYTASVSNDTRELQVTAIASDEMRAGIQISVDDGEFEKVSTKDIDIQAGHKTMRGFETAVTIKVTADDGETSKSYIVILIRSFDVAGATLQNLEVSPGQLQPKYTTATFSYTVNVAATTATIKMIPTINDNSTATITLLTGDSRTVYQANTDIPLNELGEQGNIIQVTVVSGDGEHSNIYTIKVIRAFSRNADLSDIVISKAGDPVSLTPTFNGETTTYTASVSNDTRELQVTAIASDEMRAGIQISFDDGEFEEVSTKDIDIQAGHKTTRGFETAVTIKVTADDGETSKSYTVILIRSFDIAGATLQNLKVLPGQLQPEYTTATFVYTVDVAATTATIRVIPTINDNSTATITLLTGDSRTVYQANADIPLNELGEQGNIIQVVVVSGDGENFNIYTIKIIRAFSGDADLSDIVISKAGDPVSLTPAFNVETTDYTASVSNDTQELRVTAVASDEVHANIQISVDDGEFEEVSTKDVDIQAGYKTARGFETAVTIKVTADDDETSKSYTVTLIRSFDVADATLQNLEVSPGQLQPEYTTATFVYTVNVAATTATIKVIPTINDNSTATITLVTEDSRTVYQANTDIPLNQLGEQGNIIEIMVESESGVDSNIYTIKVIRAFSRNADLSDIVISKAGDPVSLTPTFNGETTTYTASVSNDTRELQVTAIASDEMRAGIQISFDDGEFEEVSTKDIDIQAGHKTTRGFETAVTIKVTADDGETSKSYTVILIRSFDIAGATLQNLKVLPGQLQPEYTTATFVYTVDVAATTSTIRVIPTINDNSTVTITLLTGDSRTIYQANTDIPLNELGEQGNIIEVAVVPRDGEQSDIYIIRVIRPSSGIHVRAKVFLEGPLQ